MSKFSFYHLLFVVCLWQSTAILQCRASDVDQEQHFRLSQKVITHCLEKCSLATTTPSDVKVEEMSAFFKAGIENITLVFAILVNQTVGGLTKGCSLKS